MGETLGEFYKGIVCGQSVNSKVMASYSAMGSSHIFSISTEVFLKSKHQANKELCLRNRLVSV